MPRAAGTFVNYAQMFMLTIYYNLKWNRKTSTTNLLFMC